MMDHDIVRNRVLPLIDIPDLFSCWEWTGTSNWDGYGRININYHDHRAHRLVYEYFVSAIPNGLQLDHLCRNRKCCNPAHLEPVTAKENIYRGNGIAAINKRKTHCIHGHPLSGSNLYIESGTKRKCRACIKRRWREWYARNH